MRNEVGRYTPDNGLHTVVGVDTGEPGVRWFVYDKSGFCLASDTTLQGAMDFLDYHLTAECSLGDVARS